MSTFIIRYHIIVVILLIAFCMYYNIDNVILQSFCQGLDLIKKTELIYYSVFLTLSRVVLRFKRCVRQVKNLIRGA